MEVTKIFGWFLLLFGITIILGTIYSSYNIFTGKTSMPQIFKMEEFGQDISSASPEAEKSSETQAEKLLQAKTEEIIQQQLKDLLPKIPKDAITKILNLFVWSIFTGVAMFGGNKISSIGIKLIK